MENGGCEYCGYKEAAPSYTATAAQQAQQPVYQSQVIINNQPVQPTGVVMGVSRKNRIVALLLCIFLGTLGAHRFYVGKIGTGILYLFTMGLFGIGWVIDIVLIAVGAFKDQFDLPLK